MRRWIISGLCGVVGLVVPMLAGGEVQAGYNAGTGIYTDDNAWLKSYQPQSFQPRSTAPRSYRPLYYQPQSYAVQRRGYRYYEIRELPTNPNW